MVIKGSAPRGSRRPIRREPRAANFYQTDTLGICRLFSSTLINLNFFISFVPFNLFPVLSVISFQDFNLTLRDWLIRLGMEDKVKPSGRVIKIKM